MVTKWSPCGRQVVAKWSVDSGCRLTENIWFAWSNTCYKGENVRCHACDGRSHRHVKVEQYSAEAEYAIPFSSLQFLLWQFPICKLSQNQSEFPFESQLKVGELEASHFFLPHGLKLPPPLSQAIFAINSPLWFNFALFAMEYHCGVWIEFFSQFPFYTNTRESIFKIQICIWGWNENLRGNRAETKQATTWGPLGDH